MLRSISLLLRVTLLLWYSLIRLLSVSLLRRIPLRLCCLCLLLGIGVLLLRLGILRSLCILRCGS